MSKPFSAKEILLHAVSLVSESPDPSAGGGLSRAIGSMYFRSGTAGAYLKTGAGNTAWQKLVQSFAWFSVRDYKAVGDGVTDDTAQIQAAIDACAAAGGGVVFFPFGSYAVTQLTIAADAVQLRGSGPNSKLLWKWNAAGAAGSMLTVSGGADHWTVSDLQFDGSQLTNPSVARDNHLILVNGAGGGVTDGKVIRNLIGNMVANSGDGVHVVGTLGNLVSILHTSFNEFRGCSRFGVGGEQGLEFCWVCQNYFTGNETDIAIVATSDLASNAILIHANEINHTGAVRHAIRIEGGATTLVSHTTVAENVILGGMATINRVRRMIWTGNVQTSGAFASADAVIRVYGNVADLIISGSFVGRSTGATAGPCVTLERATNSPDHIRIGNNVLVNEVANGNFVTLVDISNVSVGSNMMYATDVGASTVYAIDIQAVATTVTGFLIGPGNSVTPAAGTLAAFCRLLANTATGIVQHGSVSGNACTATDYGVRFELTAGGSFTGGLIMANGNNVVAGTGMFQNVGVTVRPRIGLNGSPTLGANYIQGAGAPSAITAPIGSIYSREDGGQGSSVYYNETGGAGGWIGLGGSPIVFGAGDLGTAATAVFFAPGWIPTATATEPQAPMTRVANIRNLYVRVGTAGTGAATVTYTVRKNGADTVVTTSLSNTATGTASDTTHSVGVVAGDLLSIGCTKSGAVASGQTNVTATAEVA